ncbi:MAG TPA: cytochrome c oxidase subunit 3 [Gemmatimonadaceae bacterium]|nr:cytochrome c oxidase subunit 3 [Gemmatimonadaceae bacterium]
MTTPDLYAYAPPPGGLPVKLSGRRSPGWWGMLWFCATEAMLFACFIASYFYLRGNFEAFGAEGGKYPPIILTLPMTVILLASSVSNWWGERGIKQGNQLQLRIGLAVTFLLGLTFLIMQGFEYHDKPFGPTVSAYDSVFYTTTAFHGAHVAIGLLMNLYVQFRAWLGHFTAERHLAVENAGLYWHFVDVVWLFIFSSLYISPRLW